MTMELDRQLPPPEHGPEYDLFRDNLQRVQAEAAEGHTPTKFMAGLEIEMYIISHAEHGDRALHDPRYNTLLWHGPRFEAEQQQFDEAHLLQPTREMWQLQYFPEEQAGHEARVRDEARTYVTSLTAHTEEEQRRRQSWLAEVDSFTTTDLINFKLYQEFSTPTLGETAPPRGASYRELQEDGVHKGWLEFRFGKGTLQSGYYDNEGVTEIRLMPCPPDELIEREEIIMRRALELTTQFNGMIRYDDSTHINLSAYQYDPAVMEWMPVIGSAHESSTLDAVTGLSAAIEDGAALSEELADKPNLYGPFGGMSGWKITPYRNAIRVQEDYVELRESNLRASTAHGLLWMMSGMMEGFEHGHTALAAQGYAHAEIQRHTAPVTTGTFEKGKDLQLLRALENSEEKNTIFALDPHFAAARAQRMLAEWTGWEVTHKPAAAVIGSWLVAALMYDQTGKIAMNPYAPEMYAYHSSMVRESTDPVIEYIGMDNLLRSFKDYIDRDAVRITSRSGFYAQPQLPNLDRAGWEERWQRSPILQRAYGATLTQFAAIVGPSIDRNQAPTDLVRDVNDPQMLQRLYEHYRIGQQ